MQEWLVLIGAGFAAGVLNAVAGGGTFLSFPALVWAGVPPITANATATLAALPGYLSSSWGFRHDLQSGGALPLRHLLILSALGGVIGAILLVITPASVFTGIVPWLLLAATLLFAFGPQLMERLRRAGAAEAGWLTSALLLLAVAIYGGYFNGGLGIVLLAAFTLLGFRNLHAMNGLKSVVSSVLSVVSTATFILAGIIDWQAALPLALASALGGYLGARLSRRITNITLLRGFVTLVGAVMTVIFFLRQTNFGA